MTKRKKTTETPQPVSIAKAAHIILQQLNDPASWATAAAPLAKAQAGVRHVVRPAHMGWVGNHPGRRFGSIQYESLNERDFLNRAEIEPEFSAVIRQPVLLEWEDDEGVLRTHIPDFAALRFGKPAVLEIKTAAKAEHEEVKARTDILRDAFEAYGLVYDVLTEGWYRAQPAYENAKLLALGRPYEPTLADADAVKAYLADAGPQDAWTIAEALGRELEFAYAVYALCIDGYLKLANPAASIRACGRFVAA